MKNLYLTALAAALACIACSKNESEPEPVCPWADSELKNVTITLTDANEGAAITRNDERLSRGTTAAYHRDSKRLVTTAMWRNGEKKAVLEGVPAEYCRIYALGNADFVWPEYENGLDDLFLDFDAKDILPQSAKTKWVYPADTAVSMKMEKLYSKIVVSRKYNVHIDTDTILVVDAPTGVRPFGVGNRAHGQRGILAGADDLKAFARGDSFIFYLPAFSDDVKVFLCGTLSGDGTVSTAAFTFDTRWNGITSLGITDRMLEENKIRQTVFEDYRSCQFFLDTTLFDPGKQQVGRVRAHCSNGDTRCTLPIRWATCDQGAIQIGDGQIITSADGNPYPFQEDKYGYLDPRNLELRCNIALQRAYTGAFETIVPTDVDVPIYMHYDRVPRINDALELRSLGQKYRLYWNCDTTLHGLDYDLAGWLD